MKSGAVMMIALIKPTTNPNAPMTNVCLRNRPSQAISARKQKRSHA
jgi:hypothetical protein